MSYKRNDRALHIPTVRVVTVWQAAKDGSWAVVRFPGTTNGKKVPSTDLRAQAAQVKDHATAELVDMERFRLVTTLCYDCRYCSPLMCGYMAARDTNAGLAVVGAKAVACYLSGTLSYKVIECGKHCKGPLPPMGQVWSD